MSHCCAGTLQAGQETSNGEKWKEALETILGAHGYVCVGKQQYVGLLLAVFVQRSLHHAVEKAELRAEGCGLGGVAGNKGGISLTMWCV